MAVVSAKCQGTYGSHYTLYLDYKINSQNITNNTSNITLHMYAKSDSSSYQAYNLNSTNPVTIKVNGSNKLSRNQAMDFRNMKTVDMGTWTGNVTHNAEGKLTITISGEFTIKGTSSLSGGSVSKSWTLTTIPRASSVTCADGNIGSATTININRASSNFTHTITYSFGGLNGTIATKTSNTSIGWTIPTSFYAKIPNAKSGKVTITCDTYSGNTKVGTKTTTANVFVINSDPTISATIEDVNEDTVALTGDSSKIVRYMSNAKVDITATAKNSATIKNRKVVCGNKTGTSISNTLNNVESGTFVVRCTDTRGFSTSKTIEKTLIEYIKLVFVSISLTRPSTTSNTVNATLEGRYFNSSFGSTLNNLTLKWRYRQSGQETWSEYTQISPTVIENTFNYSANLGDIYDYNEEYEFEFVAVDKLMNITQIVTVTRGIPIIDIGKNDVKVNGDFFVTGPEWKDLGYGSGYESPGFGFAPQYRRIGNQVFLRGTSKINSGNLPNETIYPFGELPENYRPKSVVYFVAKSNGAEYVTGQVNPGGSISISPGSNENKTYMSLDNINFFID